jgi:hypothetical protein
MLNITFRFLAGLVFSVLSSVNAFAGSYVLQCSLTTIQGDPIASWSRPLTWMDDGTGPYATGGQMRLDRKEYGLQETLELNMGGTAADSGYRAITLGVKSVDRDFYVETSTEGGTPAQLDIYYLKKAIYRARCAIETKSAK